MAQNRGAAALAVLERLLARPSLFSVHELRVNPDFDALRGHPRYRALLARYAIGEGSRIGGEGD